MNYQKIYNQLTKKGFKQKPLEGYFEKHHILPKCMGGNDLPENLIYLTGRQHFLCHWLLCRIYPENNKLAQAFWLMCTDYRFGYKYSSRTYEEAKINFSIKHKQYWKYLSPIEYIKLNKKKSKSLSKNYQNKNQEEKQKIILKRKNNYKQKSQEEKDIINQKISNTYQNKSLQEKLNLINKIKQTKQNKTLEEKQQINKKIGIANSKSILQFDLQNNFIKEWPSITEASLKIKNCDINCCLKGKQLQAGGFIWKYKNQPTPEYKPKYIPKKILQIDPQTNQIIKIWKCSKQILKELNWQIYGKLNNKNKYGFKWIYKEDYK